MGDAYQPKLKRSCAETFEKSSTGNALGFVWRDQDEKTTYDRFHELMDTLCELMRSGFQGNPKAPERIKTLMGQSWEDFKPCPIYEDLTEDDEGVYSQYSQDME